MKIIKGILIALVVLAAIVSIVGFLSPRQMHVERSLTINAPAEIIHEQINNLKNWTKWSPWYQMDTAVKIEYNGTDAGAGAGYKWESNNDKVGKGEMTITSSTPDSISTALNMEYGPAMVKFLFAKSDNGTKVTWIMEGDNGMNPLARFMCLFMDGMLGKDFEKGLANIKEVAETIPVGPKTYRGYEVMEEDAHEMIYIGKKILSDGIISPNSTKQIFPPFLKRLEKPNSKWLALLPVCISNGIQQTKPPCWLP